MLRRLHPAAVLVLAACAGELPTETDGTTAFARGGKPTGGTGIQAVALINNKAHACASSAADAISSGPVTYVVGDCVYGGKGRPFLWSAASGAQLLDAVPGGLAAQAVADDGTTFGSDGRSIPFYRPLGGSVSDLPLLQGAFGGTAYDVTRDGTLALGAGFFGSEASGHLWEEPAIWSKSGPSWSVTAAPEGAVVMDGAGDVLAGSHAGQPLVWTRATGGWVQAALPTDGGRTVEVTGINSGGTVIAGHVLLDFERGEYEPVVWIVDGSGGWTLERLQGLGLPRGLAYDVETLNDGRIVVVGSADELGSTLDWAVAWIRATDATSFAAPVKLTPISRGYSAYATAISVKGEIVGVSRTKGVTEVAVMWKLP